MLWLWLWLWFFVFSAVIGPQGDPVSLDMSVAAQLLEGLHFLHNVLATAHQNLKPSNILVTARGQVTATASTTYNRSSVLTELPHIFVLYFFVSFANKLSQVKIVDFGFTSLSIRNNQFGPTDRLLSPYSAPEKMRPRTKKRSPRPTMNTNSTLSTSTMSSSGSSSSSTTTTTKKNVSTSYRRYKDIHLYVIQRVVIVMFGLLERGTSTLLHVVAPLPKAPVDPRLI